MQEREVDYKIKEEEKEKQAPCTDALQSFLSIKHVGNVHKFQVMSLPLCHAAGSINLLCLTDVNIC